MAIVSKENTDFINDNFILIISGLPSTGKSTLALSAPDVLWVDTDKGVRRVKAEHRKDRTTPDTYEELLSDIRSAKGKYKTVAIDTCGALIELMKDWVVRNPQDFPKGAKNSGGISLQGFGFVKQEFIRLSSELRKDFNVIYVFHEQMERNGDEVFYSIVCEGAARTLVFQPADLAMHLVIQNGKRYAAFTPTEQYFAKSSYGITGLVNIPDLNEGDANDFLTKLFAKVRENLKAETASLAPQQKAYDDLMATVPDMMAAITDADSANEFPAVLDRLPHALTSKKEIGNAYKNRCKELGLKWDGKKKAWVAADADNK